MINNDKLKQHLPSTSVPFPPSPGLCPGSALPLQPLTALAPTPRNHPAAQGEREWKVQSHHCLTVPLCCSFLLKLCPCSSKVLPMGCSHQFQCGLELFQETPGSSGATHWQANTHFYTYSTVVSSRGWSGICAPVHGATHPLLAFPSIFVFPVLRLTMFVYFSSTCVFSFFLFPCLNMFSQRHHCLGWGAQLCPAVNPWSWLDLCSAWGSPGLSSQRLPLKPPTQQQNSYLSEDTQWL